MNTQAAPGNDVHVRRAVAYALDRADIIAANGRYATPDYTLIPLRHWKRSCPSRANTLIKSINLYSYSLTKAKQEMAASAYPHGVRTTFLVWSYGNSVNVGEVVTSELQRIGIDAKLKVVSLNAFSANQAGPVGGRDASLGLNGCTNPDVSGYDFLLANGGDYGWAPPPAVEQLFSAGTKNTNPASRFPIFSEAAPGPVDRAPRRPPVPGRFQRRSVY